MYLVMVKKRKNPVLIRLLRIRCQVQSYGKGFRSSFSVRVVLNSFDMN